MITGLSYSNIAGRSASYGFKPLTVILGESRSGKTAALDAVYLDLLGYHPHPKIGKVKKNIVASLAKPGDSIEVRSVHAGKMAYNRTQNFGDAETKGSDGGMPFAPAMMVGLSEFSEMTASKRLDFLLSKLPDPKGAIDDKLIATVIGPVPSTLMNEYAVIPTLTEEWNEAVRSCPKGDNYIEWLTTATEHFVTKGSAWSTQAKNALQAIKAQELEDSKPENVVPDQSRYIKALEEKSNTLQIAINTFNVGRVGCIHEIKELTLTIVALEGRLAATRDTKSVCPMCQAMSTKPPTEKDASAIQSALTKARMELQAKQKEMTDTFDPKLKEFHAQQDVNEKELCRLKTIQRQFQNNQGRHSARVDQQTARLKYERQAEIQKAIVKILTDLRKKAIEDGLDGVLAPANELVFPVLGIKVVFRDGNFYLGDAPLHRFSGSEKAIVYSALQFALTIDHPEKIVVLDELGVISDKLKTAFFKELWRMVAKKKIDQVIAVDVSGTWLLNLINSSDATKASWEKLGTIINTSEPQP